MILVCGATGRIGDPVVRTLRRLSLDVRALVRKGSEYFWLNDTGCRYFFGDLRDPRSLARACEGVRYLVICADVRLETRDNNYDTVHVRGMASLLEAARAAGVERVVLVSCLGAGRGLTAPAFVARTTAEEQVAASGIPFTILRAGLPEGPLLDFAFQALDQGRALLPGPGNNLISPLASIDIARMAAASLDLASVENQIVEVGGPPRPARALFSAACAAAGAHDHATVLPEALIAAGSRLGRPLRRYAHRLAASAVWFHHDLTADPDAVLRLFGLPLTPFDEALVAAGARAAQLRDPETRERLIVHRQFYATIYEPGTALLSDLPDGPAPRAG